jgi:hypothetical protein
LEAAADFDERDKFFDDEAYELEIPGEDEQASII